jgi:hypothetical protein
MLGSVQVGFTLMEVGIILVLVAQSFSAQLYRSILFWGGMLLLLCGFFLFLTIKDHPHQ